MHDAAKLIGLGEEGRVASVDMFYNDEWPAKYQKAYDKAEANYDYAGMAKAGAERMQHYIDTGK